MSPIRGIQHKESNIRISVAVLAGGGQAGVASDACGGGGHHRKMCSSSSPDQSFLEPSFRAASPAAARADKSFLLPLLLTSALPLLLQLEQAR